MVTQIYKIRSEIWVALSSEIRQPKNIKILCNFTQLCDLIVNISGTQQDIISWKMALQTTGKLNSVFFGPQMAKNRTEFWPTQRAAIRLGIATHLVQVVSWRRWSKWHYLRLFSPHSEDILLAFFAVIKNPDMTQVTGCLSVIQTVN